MEFEHIRLEVVDHVATITLNRPSALNAFTDTMEGELVSAFDLTDHDDDVRAVVLTGAGRAFCAGMDLADGGAAFDEWSASDSAPTGSRVDDADGDELRRDGGGRVVLRMFDSLKPVVAAINGPAVGVGLTMTLAADFRIAAIGAKLGFVFTQRGLVPESCSSWFLPRLVGMQRALDWVYSGRIFRAEEAQEAGLTYAIHPADVVLAEADALARRVTESSAPVSVSLSRQLLWRMLGAEHPMTAHIAETHGLNDRGVSADAREGIAAFLEKRPAAFADRVSVDRPDVLTSWPAPDYRRTSRSRSTLGDAMEGSDG